MVLSWRARPGAATDTTRQTTILTNPVGGLGPSVTQLNLDSSLSNPITGEATRFANFDVETDLPAAQVRWSINGAVQGSATGSGKKWTFDWPLVKADGSPAFFDGTYLVRAEAFDVEGRSGKPRSYTVEVNRIPPLAPTRVEGGRNLNGNRVDLEWQANPEPDVVGYRVYRSTDPTLLGTRVCPTLAAAESYITKPSCLDEEAPSPLPGVSLYYKVVALDRAPDRSLREGQPSAPLQVVEGNSSPTQPSGLIACTGGAPDCNDADGQPAPTGTTVLTWSASTDPDTLDAIKFYRVYRGGNTYDKRYDRLYPTVGKPLTFIDSKPENGPHDYRISAVDERFGESPLSDPVTR